jgi:hypothetical protein
MTHDSLHRLGLDLRLVHKLVAKQVTKVVKSEPLAVLDLHSGRFRCRPQMICNECGRGQGNMAAQLEGRENKIPVLRVERLAVPLPQMMRQDRMQGDVTVRCFRLGFAVLAHCPAF